MGALEATEKTIGARLEKVVADRGLSDEKIQRGLAESHSKLIDHICPRSPSKMAEKKTDPDFRRSQTRRAQTEARVAIITTNYQRGRSLSRGLESQHQELRWVMLAHNLRILARKILAERSARVKLRSSTSFISQGQPCPTLVAKREFAAPQGQNMARKENQGPTRSKKNTYLNILNFEGSEISPLWDRL